MAADARKDATADSRRREAERLSWAVLLLMLSVASWALVLRDDDPDLFGRIAYARDAFARGAWTWHTDPYSYTMPGGRWIDHEWGFSWVSFATFQAGGWFALRLMSVVLMAGTAWLALQTTRHMPEAARVRPVMGLVFAPVMAMAFVGPRAQAFSYLFFAWMLWCLARSWDESPRWLLWAVAPMPLWVNIHGGFLAGLGVAALWAACRLPYLVRAKDPAALRYVGLAAGWCALSLLLQPWGWDYALHIARTGTMPRPFVPEWSAPAFLGPQWVFAVLSTAVAGVSLFSTPRRWPNIAVMGGLAVQAFLHRRHLPFLAIAVSVFGFPVLAEWWNRVRPAAVRSGSGQLLRAASIVTGLAAMLVLWNTAQKLRAPEPREPKWPAAAVDFLRMQRGGGLLVDFEWSQYAILHASPHYKVAVDGRYEEVYPDDVMQRYLAWHFGLNGWQSMPADTAAHYALVATGSTRSARLDALAPAWRRIYFDPTATIFEKTPISAPCTSGSCRQ